MAARVVEKLEVVDVDQDDGERPAVAARRLELVAERLLEVPVVGEPRERVPVGELLEAAVILLEVRGHRVEVGGEPAELVAAAPAEACPKVAGAHGLGRYPQAAEGAEDPELEEQRGEHRERDEQHAKHKEHPLVALGKRHVGGLQVVARHERGAPAAILLERGGEQLVAPLVRAQLTPALFTGAHGVDCEARLGAAPGPRAV